MGTGNVVDACDVAREKGLRSTYDAMTEEVVGGKYCRRASNFGDSAVPSAAALEHRATRVTLIRDFVAKLRRMREPEEGHSPPRRGRCRVAGTQTGSKRARGREGGDIGGSESEKRDGKSSRR